MPPKQTSITSVFGQQLERPLPFTSPDPRRDGVAVMPQTPSQRRSQSPGVIVPGTPPTPLSLKVQPVPRSMSPRFVPDYTDHQVAHANRELNAQFPPQVSGPTLSPSGTAQEFAAQLAYQQQYQQQQQQYQQQQQQQYQQQQQQYQQQQQQLDPVAIQRAQQAQLANPDIFTQYNPEHFKGGRRKSPKSTKLKTAKKSKKTNKRKNRRSKYRSRSRSKKSYFY